MTEAVPSALLLHRIAQGDQAAVTQCLNQYGGLVWSLCKQTCRSVTDAEDAVQEIFIELWKSAGRYNSQKASESTFITMIARRRLIDRLRKQSTTISTQHIEEEIYESPQAETSEQLELADDAAQARKCLDKLKNDEQQVIDLTICRGDSQQQVSSKLGLPLGTVKSHARRGLIKLKDCMKAHAFGLTGGDA